MRSLLVFFFVVAVSIVTSATAQAERRMFIVANNADGYGVDRCLARGEKCGAAMATAFCKSRDFTRAASFRRVNKNEITGGVPADAFACVGRRCQEVVAIECVR
jgi:uncharacterized DUF497 family protein